MKLMVTSIFVLLMRQVFYQFLLQSEKWCETKKQQQQQERQLCIP